MTERGVIAVDRGVFTHPRFANDPFTEREAWIWLISEAAYKPHKRRVGPVMINLRRGQVAHSLRFMAEKWQWSVNSVRRFLQLLATNYGEEDEALISMSIESSVTVITIGKYNSYQRWLRLAETPYAGVSGTASDTPTDTPTDTPQKELDLYSKTGISDEPKKTDTAANTAADTVNDTGLAQVRHRLIDSSSSSSSSESPPPPKIASLTEWDRNFGKRFLQAINFDEVQASTAEQAAAYYAVVWRTRGYDMEWAIALGAEIAHDKKKSKPPLSYYNKAIQTRQDARAREIALSVCPTITPPTQPAESNGHAAPTAHRTGSNGYSSDDWKRRQDHKARVVAEFRQSVGKSGGEGR